MRLGISSPLQHTTPEEWAQRQTELGCTTVVFPVSCKDPREKILAYKSAADRSGLTIAEVGIWCNALAKDEEERTRNRDYAVGQLRLADEIGARCAVNVAGSMGETRDGHCRENFSPEAWDLTVAMIRDIIDRAEITRTYFTIEPMPWMIPTGPEEYLRLIDAVDRERFAVHMDIINMINSAERYFFAEDLIDRCISMLGDRIRSCHIKDVHLAEKYTFRLEECAPGEGEFPLRRYVERVDAIDKDMPVILEHLSSDEDYIKYASYLRREIIV